MSAALFWGSLALVAYTYAGFPLLVLARAALFPRPHREAPVEPDVTIVVAACNEEAAIGAKLESLLALDYPRERLEIVVASDGSTDRTEEIVARYGTRGVRLLALPRTGKAGALNAAVALARGEVLVFSDANSLFHRRALRALVAPFADPEVGGVAGDQRYLADGAEDGIALGESGYWNFDRMLKRAESLAGNVISATGAIYAIRRSLFVPVVEGVTDDFATSTAVIAQGRRLVFAPHAVASEPIGRSAGVELGRKVRVITRGLNGVLLRRALLDPRRHGFYALQLFSHKVLRRLMIFPLAAAGVAGGLLWDDGLAYRLVAGGEALLLIAGVAGIAIPWRPLRRPLAFPAFFLLVNAASVVAAWNVASRRRITRWEPDRASAAAETP